LKVASQEVSAVSAVEAGFNWDTAPRVEAKHQFFHVKDFVILNFHMRGYSKTDGVRFALSQDELLLEIKSTDGSSN
jgi:hypothetical protein